MDENYRRATTGYLLVLAGSCLIYSFFIAPVPMLFVWVVTALGLEAFGQALGKYK